MPKKITSAGKMNERITFYKKVQTKDDYGTPKIDDEPVFSCWASVRIQYLKEIQVTVGTALENTITFVIRHKQPAEIKNDMTVKHNGIRYEIVSINPDLQNKEFDVIICKAVS
ncbi:phage head closure protein [Bacillus sp. FSL W8-0223]|uniref:phage head closure protein n=1 Tax=Bacillus sp. FSL W8-0223 TaxID=2954595 RepID=UPI0030F4BBAD